jgi:hypothetical protein
MKEESVRILPWINRRKLLGKDPQQYNKSSRAINQGQHDVSDAAEDLIFEEEPDISVNLFSMKLVQTGYLYGWSYK